GSIELSDIDTTPVMYELAPALNAVGRLAHAELAVRLLLTEDKRRAEEWAVEILGLNEERRYQTNLAMSMAMEQLEAMPRPLPPAIVLASRQWHPGVVGIVAGRLADMYRRPAVVISIGPDGMARGSARSVPGIDIHQAILQQKDLLVAEGGHPMAAGFSLRAMDLDEFTHRLIQTVRHMTIHQVLEHTLLIDAWVRWDELSLALYDDLARLAPFGEGNPTPILAARSLTLASIETVGERREHYRLRLTDEAGISHEVIWFNGDRDLLPQGPLDLAFALRQNLYGGTRRMQIELVAVRRTPATPIPIPIPEHTLEVLDLRASSEGIDILRHWAERASAGESIALWGEGKGTTTFPFLQRRDQLSPAETLAIWSVPPGPEEFAAALDRTGARRLVLIYGDCPPADLRTLLLDLMGLVKHTLRAKQGEARLSTLAGLTAQRKETVLLGLELLSDLDVCMFERIGDDNLFFLRYRPQTVHWADVITSPLSSSLRRLLEETSAYRRFQRQAQVEQVLPAGFRSNVSPPLKV
ncbi:MAG: DHHA1 domain-containing protein, partial [Anaerolineae bacterium]